MTRRNYDGHNRKPGIAQEIKRRRNRRLRRRAARALHVQLVRWEAAL